MLLLFFLLFWQPATFAQATEKPLPDAAAFVQQVRKKLRSDRMLLSQYTYTEKITARELDKSNKVKKTILRTFEVYPSLEEGLTYRRLISKDGKSLSPRELDKQDREHTKKVEDHQRNLEREGTDGRSKRLAKEAEERRKEDENIDEIFRLYDVRLLGRRVVDGVSAIELAFQPRPDHRAKTREARMLSKMRGRAWFGEDDHEMVRIEINLIDDISLGLGLVAKLNKGASMVFQRRRINDEIWLPAEAHFAGSGRLLLFKGLHLDTISEYSNYTKFTVETHVKYSTERKP